MGTAKVRAVLLRGFWLVAQVKPLRQLDNLRVRAGADSSKAQSGGHTAVGRLTRVACACVLLSNKLHKDCALKPLQQLDPLLAGGSPCRSCSRQS